jgi:DNA polymerase-3 subunit delta
VLLITSGKLDRDALTSVWLQALDRAGVVLQVWPLTPRETVQWIRARLADKRLRLDRDAVNLLAERAQGNLLAANQEVEKLALLYGEGHAGRAPLDRERIFADVSDSARYTIFDLADAALTGDCTGAVRTLHGLAAEDTKPALVLWLLAEVLRALIVMSQANGRETTQPLKQSALRRRVPLLKRALKRESRGGWEAWLARCAYTDRVIKGWEPGAPWDELLNLTLGLCGKPLFAAGEGV